MQFFILQFLGSFAIYMAFTKLISCVQLLFIMHQAISVGRYKTMISIWGFLAFGIFLSCFIAFFPEVYFDNVAPYKIFYNFMIVIFCFSFALISLTDRFAHNNAHYVAYFLFGAFLAFVSFTFYASFIVMFSMSLGRIGVTSYLFENFALSIACLFLILSLFYYYIVMILTLKPITNRVTKMRSYLDISFACSFAILAFGLLP